MRIEVEHTREDWRAYLRFITQRTARQRRSSWIAFTAVAVAIALLLVAISSATGWRFDAPSAFLTLAVLVAALLVVARLNRSAAGIPGSWLGPQTYELREDGIHATTSTGHALIEWRAVREVHETDAHLFVRLDEISSLVLPRRYLEPNGGAAGVRAEIERLMRSASAAATAQQEASSPSSPPPAFSSEPAASPAATSAAANPWMALPRNLLAGLRLTFFLPLRPEHFSPSGRQVVLLAALAVGGWILLDRLNIDGEAQIIWFSLAQVLGLSALVAAMLILVGPRQKTSQSAAGFTTAVAAASPFLVLIGLLLALPGAKAAWCRGLMLILPILAAIVLYRAQRVAVDELPPAALLRAIVIVVGTWWLFESTLYVQPRFWYSPESAEESADAWADAEGKLFGQPDLIDAAVSRVQPGHAGLTETYFIGFAGFGEQAVFDREVRFARDSLARRIDLDGRSVELINSPQPDAAMPFATVSGLRRALAGVAQRMNLEEDVLILLLTSHGSEDAQLSVTQGVLPLEPLGGADLRAALDAAGIRWRIIVISACHSGSFIPHLEDAHTLVATASRADRSSFGCSDERELTYFGEALFRDALPASHGMLDAFERARAIVRQHEVAEKVEGKDQSEPQVYVGERMRAKLADLKFRTAS